MNLNEFQLISMYPYGYQRIPMDLIGSQMDPNGFQWIIMNDHECNWQTIRATTAIRAPNAIRDKCYNSTQGYQGTQAIRLYPRLADN